ncbi:hypothetical protein AHMF7616_01814 [Adhaeribacter pallidiroseus]|uniref:Uncharacterized protein n=1 Tax=Adhaeribacter pallidiroseus TaxID=2072847 RepID=A0A369QE59_9BACT|nr:hypothetical protein AHMF7616_01814 [Adhaeribacter pallidiroseus]
MLVKNLNLKLKKAYYKAVFTAFIRIGACFTSYLMAYSFNVFIPTMPWLKV